MRITAGALAGNRASRYTLVANGINQLLLPVPFGMHTNIGMKVRVATDARGRMVRVIVHELQDAVLFPIYTATEKLKDATISIKLISDYAEKQQVLDLLERLHYRRHA